MPNASRRQKNIMAGRSGSTRGRRAHSGRSNDSHSFMNVGALSAQQTMSHDASPPMA